MEALKIETLRPGADGMNRNAPNAANYDESKANPYPNLPDPLTLKNGEKVTTAEQWWSKRRPEIVEDFDREVYGRVPKDVPKVTWEVTETTEEKVGDVAVVTKRLVGHVDNAKCPEIKVDIQLTLTTPADAKGPVPVMMEFGFGGFGPRPGGPAGKAATPKGIAPKAKAVPPAGSVTCGPSWQQQVLAKGWGYAIIVPNSIQADNGAGLTKGIIGLCNKGQPRKPDDWGALRAWAWGASRALDYFETDKAVDAKQVGIEGLSRYGKAALVAMAYDQRFAIGFIGSSGEGGAKLHRRNFGELVENLTGSGEYHWMAGQLPQVRRPAHAGRSAGGRPRADRPVRTAADLHQLRGVDRSGGRGAVGRPARQLHGGRRGRPGLQAAGQEGPGHLRIPRGRDGPDRRRPRLPAAQGRPHHRPELADVPGVRRPLHQGQERPDVGRGLTAGVADSLPRPFPAGEAPGAAGGWPPRPAPPRPCP